MRPSDALGPLVEFFELHAEGARIPADVCEHFRDALAEIQAGARKLENIVERHLASMSGDPPWDGATGYSYDHALQHQRNRELVKNESIPVDDKVVALPNAFRQEAAARLAALGDGA